jgi:hypothetical protein
MGRVGCELRGKTHPARATLTCAPGGVTLGREEGELDAVFTCLGVFSLDGHSQGLQGSGKY